MKSLFTVILSLLLMGDIDGPEVTADLKLQTDPELEFKNYVKIYNYEGTLIRELSVEDVSEGTISVIDYLILDSSDYAFDLYGNYYYFTDEQVIGDLIN